MSLRKMWQRFWQRHTADSVFGQPEEEPQELTMAERTKRAVHFMDSLAEHAQRAERQQQLSSHAQVEGLARYLESEALPGLPESTPSLVLEGANADWAPPRLGSVGLVLDILRREFSECQRGFPERASAIVIGPLLSQYEKPIVQVLISIADRVDPRYPSFVDRVGDGGPIRTYLVWRLSGGLAIQASGGPKNFECVELWEETEPVRGDPETDSARQASDARDD